MFQLPEAARVHAAAATHIALDCSGLHAGGQGGGQGRGEARCKARGECGPRGA